MTLNFCLVNLMVRNKFAIYLLTYFIDRRPRFIGVHFQSFNMLRTMFGHLPVEVFSLAEIIRGNMFGLE